MTHAWRERILCPNKALKIDPRLESKSFVFSGILQVCTINLGPSIISSGLLQPKDLIFGRQKKRKHSKRGCITHQTSAKEILRVCPHARWGRRKVCGLSCGCFFLCSSLPSAELSGLHILSAMKGELSLCITMTFRALFIQPLSNGLWTANAPPSGSRSPLITPPIPTRSPPQKLQQKSGESAPVVWAAAPGLFRNAGNFFFPPMHLNCTKKRSVGSYNVKNAFLIKVLSDVMTKKTRVNCKDRLLYKSWGKQTHKRLPTRASQHWKSRLWRTIYLFAFLDIAKYGLV